MYTIQYKLFYVKICFISKLIYYIKKEQVTSLGKRKQTANDC